MQGYVRAHQHHAVSHDFPQSLCRRGVLGHGVIQLDVHTGILYPGTVQLHGLFLEVDAPALDRQESEGAFYTGRIHETIGVKRGVLDLQRIYNNLLFQQRPKLDIDHQLPYVGNGVVFQGGVKGGR